MRILSQLVLCFLALVMPLLIVGLLLWNLILPGVAEFICGAVDQVAFNIALVIVMLGGFWFAGLVGGVISYYVLESKDV